MTSHYGGVAYNYSKPVNVFAWPVEGDLLLATGTIRTWNQTAVTWNGSTSANYVFRLDQTAARYYGKHQATQYAPPSTLRQRFTKGR
jgi:hypothetical protein